MTTIQLSRTTHTALQARKRARGLASLDAVVADLLQPTPKKADVVGRIRLIGPALRELGVEGIRLFGSVRSDTARPGSDIDLIVDLEDDRDYLDLARIQRLLETVMGAPCDVVLPEGLHPRLAPRILAEAEALSLG